MMFDKKTQNILAISLRCMKIKKHYFAFYLEILFGVEINKKVV